VGESGRKRDGIVKGWRKASCREGKGREGKEGKWF